MVQEAAAQQRNPTQGKQVSGSRCSMWPVLVLGILTAIFSWLWYRGNREVKEPETQKEKRMVDTAVTAETGQESRESGDMAAQLAPRERELNTADPDLQGSNRSRQGVSCLGIQDTKTDQARNDEKPGLQVKKTEVLSHIDPLVDEQSEATATVNVPVIVGADVPTRNGQGNMQRPKKSALSQSEHPIYVPEEEGPQTAVQEQPTDVPGEEEPHTAVQEQPIDVPGETQDQVNVLEQTSVPVKGENLLEGHFKYLVGNDTEEGHKENELHSCVDLHFSTIPDSREMLINGDKVHPSLKMGLQLGHDEGYPQDNIDTAATQTSGKAVCLTSISQALGLMGDSCHTRMAASVNEPGKEFLQPVKDIQDGFCASGEMNRTEDSIEKATGWPLENVFVVKEDKNAMNVLTAQGTLSKDLYLEMVNKSKNDGNAIFGDHINKQESVEKSDNDGMYKCIDFTKTSGLQENANVTSSLQESSKVELSDVQKLESGPKGSSVNMFNQEEEIIDLSISNAHEKTSLSCPSEENIHEIDNQKTRKVATIQPMPQNVNFVFKVHYITQSDSQIIAITGDHETLGKWETYIPLTAGNGGFWSRSITLPADTILAWKFVMVENGKIKRWEECNNRFLKVAHEDLEAQLWWGHP